MHTGNVRTHKEGAVMDANPIRFFHLFEKTSYSKGLKLSVAVYSSSAKMLVCQLCVCHF